MGNSKQSSGNRSGVVMSVILVLLMVGGYLWLQAQPDAKILSALDKGDLQTAQALLETADADCIASVFESCRDDQNQTALTDACSGLSAARRVMVAEEMTRLGMKGEAFLKSSVEGTDAAAAAQALSALEGDVRARMAKVYGTLYTQTDDILYYVYQCAQIGVKPSEAYPKGVVLDMDMSGAAKQLIHSALSPYPNTWMVVSRTEKEEPAEPQFSADLPGSSAAAFSAMGLEGYSFPADFDENDKSDPLNYAVCLETAYMDSIPADRLPRSAADCQNLLLLDTAYACEGTLTSTEKTTVNGMTSSTVKYYPVYACIQRTYLLSGEAHEIVQAHGLNVVSPPEPPKGEHAVSERDVARQYIFKDLGMNSGISKKYCVAKPDKAWMDDMARKVVAALDAAEWDITRAIIVEE